MEICLFIAHIFDLFIVVMSIRVIWLCNVESSKIFFGADLCRFAQICSDLLSKHVRNNIVMRRCWPRCEEAWKKVVVSIAVSYAVVFCAELLDFLQRNFKETSFCAGLCMFAQICYQNKCAIIGAILSRGVHEIFFRPPPICGQKFQGPP